MQPQYFYWQQAYFLVLLNFDFEVTNRGTGGPNEYNPISIHIEVKRGDTIETSVGPKFDINFRQYLGDLKKEAEEILEKNGASKIEALDTIMAHWEPGRKISYAISSAVSFENKLTEYGE